jgi:hypothetical protein
MARLIGLHCREGDVLDVILEIAGADRRRSDGTVVSAQTTYRSVTNAQSVSDQLEQGFSVVYNNMTYEVPLYNHTVYRYSSDFWYRF